MHLSLEQFDNLQSGHSKGRCVGHIMCKVKRVYTSEGRIFILGQIVLASGQIFRPEFCPQDELIWPGMAFRPLNVEVQSEAKICSFL